MLFSFIPSPGGWDDANLLELEDKVESPCFNLYPGQPYQHVGLCLNVFPYPAEVLTAQLSCTLYLLQHSTAGLE